jgi:hypothetical protein
MQERRKLTRLLDKLMMVTDGIQRESMDGKGEKGKKRKKEKGRGGKGWVDGREGEEAGDPESLRGAEWFYQRRNEEIESWIS